MSSTNLICGLLTLAYLLFISFCVFRQQRRLRELCEVVASRPTCQHDKKTERLSHASIDLTDPFQRPPPSRRGSGDSVATKSKPPVMRSMSKISRRPVLSSVYGSDQEEGSEEQHYVSDAFSTPLQQPTRTTAPPKADRRIPFPSLYIKDLYLQGGPPFEGRRLTFSPPETPASLSSPFVLAQSPTGSSVCSSTNSDSSYANYQRYDSAISRSTEGV